jgi:HK97 family phage major capsid protein
MSVIELKEKRMKLWETSKAFLTAKQDSDGNLSAEDEAAFDKMETEIANLGKQIKRAENLEAVENELNQPVGVAVRNTPANFVGMVNSRPQSTDIYHKDFINWIRKFRVTDALSVGEDANGGYLVPDEFERRLIEALEMQNIIRSLATIIRTDSGERKIPVVASVGEAAWVEEEGDIPESDNKFNQISLTAHKVATMIKISNELLNDSAFNMEAYIANEFARRIGNREEEAFIIGDGNKKPTGLLAASGGANVAVTTASATEITLDEVLDLFYSLKQPYRSNASFIANDLTMKELRKLKDSNGQYLWQPSIKEGTPDMIVGRPIHTSAFIPKAEAGNKALVFGDYSYYWIADRQSRTFQRLNEVYAKNGQVGFIATQRVDGKLILPEAVQCLKMGAGGG